MEYQLFIRIIKGELGFTVVATGDWFPCDNWFHGKLRYSDRGRTLYNKMNCLFIFSLSENCIIITY